jgi:hypothetical protein
MSDKAMKWIGYGITVLGLGVSVITTWLNEQRQERLITEKVVEVINKQK